QPHLLLAAVAGDLLALLALLPLAFRCLGPPGLRALDGGQRGTAARSDVLTVRGSSGSLRQPAVGQPADPLWRLLCGRRFGRRQRSRTDLGRRPDAAVLFRGYRPGSLLAARAGVPPLDRFGAASLRWHSAGFSHERGPLVGPAAAGFWRAMLRRAAVSVAA